MCTTDHMQATSVPKQAQRMSIVPRVSGGCTQLTVLSGKLQWVSKVLYALLGLANIDTRADISNTDILGVLT